MGPSRQDCEDFQGEPARCLPPRILAAAVLGGALIGTAILRAFPPGQCPGIPHCRFHGMTHLFCASCGSTRALGILARGNLLEAMRMNALACLAAGYLIAASAVCLLTGAWRLGPSLSARSALTLGVLILLFMVLRNIRVIPFIYLAPSG